MKEFFLKLDSIKKIFFLLQQVITAIKRREWEEFKDDQKKETMRQILYDSLTLRFNSCTQLFFKFLKIYLEEFELIFLGIAGWENIIREATKIKLISEDEGSLFMSMIVNRNKTSHMYHQEVAQEIAAQIPDFYALMFEVMQRVQKRISE